MPKPTKGSATARHAVERSRAREELVIALLLAGTGTQEIARQAKVSRSSVWRLRRTEAFQARFEAAKRAALDAAVNALHDCALTFVTTLRDVCTDPKARGSEKATAARSGLDSLLRAIEVFEQEARIRKLEAVVGEGGEK